MCLKSGLNTKFALKQDSAAFFANSLCFAHFTAKYDIYRMWMYCLESLRHRDLQIEDIFS